MSKESQWSKILGFLHNCQRCSKKAVPKLCKNNDGFIPYKIYKNIEHQFSKHHLLVDSPIKEEKFQHITKNHILLFLKELGYSNHYENVHLIHYNFTGIKPDDISYLEEQLLDDFDALTDLYDKQFKNINRKNFINTQFDKSRV